MKKFILVVGILVGCLIITTSSASAQQKVSEKDVLGTWKMVIEIDAALEEAEDELEEEDNWFASAIVSSVSGLVSGVMENIDIYMDFREGGELKITIYAFDEKEIEWAEWYIERGRLYIEDTDNFKSGDNDYWMKQDDLLISYDDWSDKEEEYVYMVRVD